MNINRKKIISVIGYANINLKIYNEVYSLAYNMGKSIIDNGYILANGGLGGVMEAASRGAKASSNYKDFSIIGILPNYNKDIANDYIDIPLPIGFDVGRNISLISVSDAVVVIGGGAGTLNEISLAWQMGKLIIALGDFGWGGKLADTSLDDRRDDRIYKADSIKEVLNIMEQKILSHDKIKFSGISKTMSKNTALEKISLNCNVDKKQLKFLGNGSNGFVFTDNKTVYKIFKKPSQVLFLHLKSLSNKLKDTPYQFNIIYNEDLILHYEYKNSLNFKDAVRMYNFTKEDFQELLTQCYFCGIVHVDMKPENLVYNNDGKLFICDIDFDMMPFTDEFFESMCRRTFAIYKLQYHLDKIENIRKYYLSHLNNNQDFSSIAQFLKCSNLDDEFKSFRNGIGYFALHKNIIIDFYAKEKQYKTIFDYGSGHASISNILQNKFNKKVYAYEIDDGIIKKYQENYNKIEYFSNNHAYIENCIKENKKFDSVLCSLVLCHPLAETEKERLKIIDDIMQDLCNLAKKHILIVICNPLFNNAISNIQRRLIDDINFDYNSTISFYKQILSSNRKREDIHRPLGFYEALFKRYNLKIKNIIQSGDFRVNYYKITNSDFIIFDLTKNK